MTSFSSHSPHNSTDPPAGSGRSLFVPTLANQIAPIQLQLTGSEDGELFALDVTSTPISPVFDLWPCLTRDATSRTLIIDLQASDSVLRNEAQWTTDELNWSSSPVAVLDDAALRRSIGILGSRNDVLALRLSGPVEACDVAAIVTAAKIDCSILSADLRLEQAVRLQGDGVTRIESREKPGLLAMAGRLFQVHLSRVRQQPWSDFGMPGPWQIEHLLMRTGVISIRPIETEVYSSFVDVGVSTEELPGTGPAGTSLIYDLISGTWHDEP